jgi:hypothetical protein
MKTISVEVSEEFDRLLRIKAALLDMNRPQLIRKILEEKSAQWDSLPSLNTSTTQPHMAAAVTSDAVARNLPVDTAV